MVRPYQQHLQSSKSLETTYAAVRAGFVALALEKNRRATPFVAQARAWKAAASKAKTPMELLKLDEIQPGLLTAAGVSDKAAHHLQESDKREAVSGLIKNFLEPAGTNFIEELVFRFLLTRGDTLGGSMRNIGGFLAQKKLTRNILAHLKLAGRNCRWLHADTNVWSALPDNDADVESALRGLSWTGTNGPRTVLYNVKVPWVANNVDLVLLNCPPHEPVLKPVMAPTTYIALGELKGGIDPAGADEHWKTAGTALRRIRSAFAKRKLKPHTFFIGAAVEARMAKEIWDMLKPGDLENSPLTRQERVGRFHLCDK